MSLSDAVSEFVHDGDEIALEGFTHLIPFAAGHEIIRQRRKRLTLVRMNTDLIYDQMIGAGCAERVVFSWAGNAGVGSLHRFRAALERGIPTRVEIDEYTHAGMTLRFVAGASGLPFGVLRGHWGTGLADRTTNIKEVICPYTHERLAAVPALNPDVAIIHAQQADRDGNVHLWGISGVQKEAVLASRSAVVTVEEITDQFSLHRNSVVLPWWTINAICVVPNGAYPSYALGYSERDNRYYQAWDLISRDYDTFSEWVQRNIHETAGFDEFLSRQHGPTTA